MLFRSLSEVPRGWDFFIYSYHCTHSKVKLKFHGGGKFDIFLLVYTLNVNSRFHGGGNFDIFLPLYTLKGLSEVPRGGIFDIFLPLYTFKVNLKFHGVGIWMFLTLVHIQGQFEVHGVSQGSACDHREGVRSCAIRRPAELHNTGSCVFTIGLVQNRSWTYNAFERGMELSEC